MRRRIRPRYRVGLTALFALAAMALFTSGASATVAGAGFTTFDATQGGCNDSPNGIDCNNYDTKDDVYMSGGPNAAGLSDGSYFFAVLTPGSQNGGFVDGASGNLSDTTAGGTVGDNGSGDDVANRTFTVTDHQISSYGGTHLPGTSPNGRDILQLSPYDDTDNAGGVYILAICQTDATSPSQCKYDAFRVQACDEPCVPTLFGTISGGKYYDANANGNWDPTEVGIPNWAIDVRDGFSHTYFTGGDGTFSTSLTADDYTVTEQQPNNNVCVTEIINNVSYLVCAPAWVQSGNVTDQTADTGANTSDLAAACDPDLASYVYCVHVEDNSSTSGLYFGNLCVGAGGGLTIGFWSNKNGQKLVGSTDLAMLVDLNLRNADGSNFDPATYSAYRSWLLKAKATNMAYMLSAQLSGMELNVFNGKVSGSSLIYAPGTTSANASGFATVNAVMAEANTELGLHGLTKSGSAYRSYQEALKTALDRANNNLTFVQADGSSCPTPTFTPLP
jgi:hypothetical protein